VQRSMMTLRLKKKFLQPSDFKSFRPCEFHTGDFLYLFKDFFEKPRQRVHHEKHACNDNGEPDKVTAKRLLEEIQRIALFGFHQEEIVGVE